jgi:hypothetical protein
VCVQKNGGPIACEQPTPGCLGGASNCGCLPSSDGTCTPSSNVGGLCVCQTQSNGCNCAPGQICVQQVGGPVIQIYPPPPPNLICVTPSSGCQGGPAACGCVTGQGRCSPSTSGPSQCTCDNGIR